MVTHDDRIPGYADRVVAMKDGVLTEANDEPLRQAAAGVL